MERCTVTGFRWACSIAAATLVLASCYPAHKLTATKAIVHNDLCAEAWLDYPNQPHPMWEEVKSANVQFSPGFTAPGKYKTYRTNIDTLRHFFNGARIAGSNYAMILPVPGGCEAFVMQASGTMAAGLQDKYPNLVSLKGSGAVSKTAELRADWNGETVRAQLRYNGAIYYLSPATIGNEPVYVLYNREDTGDTKEPFEAAPGSNGHPEPIRNEHTGGR